jgi:hypothetical protein
MKNVGTSVKVFLAAKMKFAVVFTLISFAFGIASIRGFTTAFSSQTRAAIYLTVNSLS